METIFSNKKKKSQRVLYENMAKCLHFMCPDLQLDYEHVKNSTCALLIFLCVIPIPHYNVRQRSQIFFEMKQ